MNDQAGDTAEQADPSTMKSSYRPVGGGSDTMASPSGVAADGTYDSREAPTLGTDALPPITMASGSALPEKIGRFVVTGMLGQGGFGTVYRGRDLGLERDVAIKVLSSGNEVDKDTVLRFEREARALAKVTHPNITAIFESGKAGDQSYFVMELVDGTSLDRRLSDGAIPLAETLRILYHSVKGLKAALKEGIVHRDIKPANILISPDGEVKLTDFGLAKPIDGGSDLTAPHVIVGSPHYMSPEQARGEDLDHKSDMYSLGVTLYQMLAGKPPFQGKSAVEILSKHIRETPPPIENTSRELPAPLRSLLQRLLAKEPASRPADYDEILRILDSIIPMVSSGLLPIRPSKMVPAVSGDPDPMRLVLGGVLILGAVAAFMLARMMGPGPQQAQQSQGSQPSQAAPSSGSATTATGVPLALAAPTRKLDPPEPWLYRTSWLVPDADPLTKMTRAFFQAGLGRGMKPVSGKVVRFPLDLANPGTNYNSLWGLYDQGWDAKSKPGELKTKGHLAPMLVFMRSALATSARLEVRFKDASPQGSLDLELVATPASPGSDSPHFAYRARLDLKSGAFDVMVTDPAASKERRPKRRECGTAHELYSWKQDAWRVLGQFAPATRPGNAARVSFELKDDKLTVRSGEEAQDFPLPPAVAAGPAVMVWPRLYACDRADLVVDEIFVTGEPLFWSSPCRSGMVDEDIP